MSQTTTPPNAPEVDVLAVIDRMRLQAMIGRAADSNTDNKELIGQIDEDRAAYTAVAALLTREAALVARNADLEELFAHFLLSDKLMAFYEEAQAADRGDWSTHLPEAVLSQLHEVGYKGRIVAVACGKKLSSFTDENKALRDALIEVRDNVREDSPDMWQRIDAALALGKDGDL